MATVKLGWRKFSTDDGSTISRCKVRARSGEDALYMEVLDRGPTLIRKYNVTAYYWVESSQRRILTCPPKTGPSIMLVLGRRKGEIWRGGDIGRSR